MMSMVLTSLQNVSFVAESLTIGGASLGTKQPLVGRKIRSALSAKKSYKDLERLTQHMEEAHQGKCYSPQVCDKCGKILRNKDSLRVHKSTNCK